MAETLSLISIIAFVAAAICLIVTIVIFIKFKIPSVVGDLSGKTARKSIEQMRELNEKSGKKSYKPSKTNAERGKLTETMHSERKKGFIKGRGESERPETGLLEENMMRSVIQTGTTLLQDENTTRLLEDENTTVALDVCEESHSRGTGGISIEILEEIMLVHTDEVIL